MSTELKVKLNSSLEDLVEENKLSIDSEIVNSKLYALSVNFCKDNKGYRAVLINEETDLGIVIMKCDNDGKSEDALFALCLSQFKIMNLDNFIIATLTYIEDEVESIEEFLLSNIDNETDEDNYENEGIEE